VILQKNAAIFVDVFIKIYYTVLILFISIVCVIGKAGCGMSTVIEMDQISKIFRVLNRHPGLKGTISDLFSRDYRDIVAVDRVSMSIEEGEILGYLGPNGAGKSTTIKMMTGILEPTSGKILINGRVPYTNRTLNAQHIGVVFGQRTQLWWALPVLESFRILKDMYCIPDKIYKSNMEMFDHLVGVSDLYNKPVRQMSLGQRTLCDILAAFLHDPSVVFLDEPTIGLDVSMKSKIRELITHLNREKNTTVVLTTHDMGDVEALCRRIMIVDHGKLIYDDSIQQLKQFFGAYRTLKILPSGSVVFTDEQLAAYGQDLLKVCPEARNVVFGQDEEWITIFVPEDEVPLMKVLISIQAMFPIKDMRIEEISIETVIRKIYEGEANEKTGERADVVTEG
jgi:ABC-type uncharacterized transport system ATPase subunit